MQESSGTTSEQIRDAALIFLAAMVLMAIYSLITRGTYEYDEFAYLLTGRAMASGQVPYRDFMLFFPPGIVTVIALLNPLVQHSWVLGRSVSYLLDAGTCSLVYLVARRISSRPVALAAGLLCASSPIMLITGTRILPDIYVAFFTFLALYLLLVRDSNRWAIAAGLAFAVAIIFKYPAVLTLPACLIVAGRRRWPYFLGATVLGSILLVLPFLPEFGNFAADTILYQSGRSAHGSPASRLLNIVLLLIMLQPLGFFGLFVKPRHPWLLAGYVSAFLYILTPQVYYHYMAPMIPFASILGALYLSRLRPLNLRVLVPAASAIAVAVTLIWSVSVEYTPGYSPFHAAAAQLSQLQTVEQFILRHTKPGADILDDRPELAILTGRNNCGDYFWSDSEVMSAQDLLPCLDTVRYVIHSYGAQSGYPNGFLAKIGDYCWYALGSGERGGDVYDLDRPEGHHGCPYLPTRS